MSIWIYLHVITAAVGEFLSTQLYHMWGNSHDMPTGIQVDALRKHSSLSGSSTSCVLIRKKKIICPKSSNQLQARGRLCLNVNHVMCTLWGTCRVVNGKFTAWCGGAKKKHQNFFKTGKTTFVISTFTVYFRTSEILHASLLGLGNVDTIKYSSIFYQIHQYQY